MEPDANKHLMVGTAGHVDHGKTALIMAMTGINTDRLKEEQERGLTIDLGFAHLELPGGRTIGIVDVPGHERFLKNMLAGASGVDIALLVVAADEGVMPQTREHLEILELLETKLGLVALTKCDLVEDEWLEVVEEDVRDALKETFLGSARVIRVSSVTGQGVEEIVREIDRLAATAEQRQAEGPFRLPIDRVFTMTGFGTVVTGSLASGTIRLGDQVRILPQGLDSRVRQIQVHGKKVEAAYAGTRTAVNLVGVEVSDIERGDVLVPPGHLQPTGLLDAWVRVLAESPRPLEHRTRVRLHVGTAEAIGRAAVLGAQKIAPGESGFVQLRLERPVVAARGDRFVLRFYSPMQLLGGGTILDPAPAKHRRSDRDIFQRLERKLKGEPADLVDDVLASRLAGLPEAELSHASGLAEADLAAALGALASEGRAFQSGGRWFAAAAFEAGASRIEGALQQYHAANPIKSGMPKEELRAALGARIDQKGLQSLLAEMSARGKIAASESTVRLPDHQPKLAGSQQKLAAQIESDYKSAGVNPPLVSELTRRHGAESKEVTALLIERGDLIRVTPDLCFHREAVERAEKALRDYLAAHGQMTVAEFRDVIGSSRKYVVPMLEYFDAKRVTRRAGDLRTLWR